MAARSGSAKSYTVPFTVLAVVALVSVVLPVITKMPSTPASTRPEAPTEVNAPRA